MENRFITNLYFAITVLLLTSFSAAAKDETPPADTTPAADAAKPAEATTPPDTEKKVDGAASSTTDPAKPADTTTPPAADAAKPADTTTPPAADATKPADTTTPPATDAPKPADGTTPVTPMKPEKEEKATAAILDPGAAPEAPPPTLPHRPPSGASSGLPAGIENISKDDFVKTKPIDIPIIKDGHLQGYFGITIVWQGKDKAAAEEIKNAMPRLQDLIITDLYGALYLTWKPGFLPDKAFVMKRIKLSAEKVLKPGVVVGVFTEDFYVKKKAGKDVKDNDSES